MNYFLRIFIVILMSLSCDMAMIFAYEYSGLVTDDESGEEVPYASVFVQGTTIGTTADKMGRFTLKTEKPLTTLTFTFIGYKDKTIQVKHDGLIGNIKLKPDNMLDEVVVTKQKFRYKRKGNPSVDFIKRILERKDTLDPRKSKFYTAKCYMKQTFAITHADDIMSRHIRKGRDVSTLEKSMDTSGISGVVCLPIYTEETISKLLHKERKDSIIDLASRKISVLDVFPEDMVSAVITDAAHEINLYDNRFRLLFQDFTSPLANISTISYHYFITDTIHGYNNDTSTYIKVNFAPANLDNFGFVGYMLVAHDSTYSVKLLNMKLSEASRINFITGMKIEQEFNHTNEGYCTLSKSKIELEGSLLSNFGAKNMKGLYVRVERTYSPFMFGESDLEENNIQKTDTTYNHNEEITAVIDTSILDTSVVYNNTDTVMTDILVNDSLTLLPEVVTRDSVLPLDSAFIRQIEQSIDSLTMADTIDISSMEVVNTSTVIVSRDTINTQKFQTEEEKLWAEFIPENEQGVKDIKELQQKMSNSKAIKATTYILKTIIDGYLPIGGNKNPKFYIGPVLSLVSTNHLEKVRFQVGGQTGAGLCNRFFVEAYGAYGIRDQKWKYKGEIEYSFVDKERSRYQYPRRSIIMSYISDCDMPSNRYTTSRNSTIFNSLRWEDPHEFAYYKRAQLTHMYEFRGGMSYTISLLHSKEWAADDLVYKHNATGEIVDRIRTTELDIKVDYAPIEVHQNGLKRFTVTNMYPHISLTHNISKAGWCSDYTFNRTEICYDQRFSVSPIGFIDVYFKAGKVWNKVPYPLLFYPSTNLSYFSSSESLQMMRSMEFVSDQYLSLEIQHFLDGCIFSHIPGIKKLEIREFWTFRAFYGGLTNKNNPHSRPNDDFLFQLPNNTTFMSKPYMELSFGIYNILKMFKVEAVRRLNYLENPNVKKWGVRFGFMVTF